MTNKDWAGLYHSKNPIRLAFYFFNHSILGRTHLYQPQKIKRNRPKEFFICSNCGKSIRTYVLDSHDRILCRPCKWQWDKLNLSKERMQIAQNAADSAEEFKDLLANCEKKRTCDILTSHKELLKDDNNRLRTDFLLKLICKNDYETEWNKIKANVKATWNG